MIKINISIIIFLLLSFEALSGQNKCDFNICFKPDSKTSLYETMTGHKAFIESGRMYYGPDMKDSSNNLYLVLWTWHYFDKEYNPIILDILDGACGEVINVKDINGDGIQEVLVWYYTGAYCQNLNIYRQTNSSKFLEILPNGKFTSGLSDIRIGPEKENNYPVIISFHKDYDFKGNIPYFKYRWDGKGYVLFKSGIAVNYSWRNK